MDFHFRNKGIVPIFKKQKHHLRHYLLSLKRQRKNFLKKKKKKNAKTKRKRTVVEIGVGVYCG